ncbi:5'-nucleotidase, cytosolic III [Cichlidogyrus casuarinus]|uniref:5'-nucleotidase n=1 Tax=Cichlidogyrus casuarinus TaxID=1844966 RepID=A0ABD2Q2E9_9PLAT
MFNEILLKKSDSGHLFIRDINNTKRKLERFMQLNIKSLQVVSDFDRTLSKFKFNGVNNLSCYGVFEQDPELTPLVRSKELTKKYYPIEINPNMPDHEKLRYMIEWWEQAHEVMIQAKLHKDCLIKTAYAATVYLREQVPEFIQLAQLHHIPVLIFSAGLGDVIEPIMKKANLYLNNVHIVSNFMAFNQEGLLVGFKEPLIHVFNKNIATVCEMDYYKTESSKRSCVLLCGDSTGDVHMSDGANFISEEEHATPVENSKTTVLRIGFLNEHVEENLDRYKEIYDIVLVDDDSFDLPMLILRSMIENETV